MKNKLIGIILIFSLLNSQLFAGGFFQNSLSNTIPAMSGNVNGQNVYYTGGFSYKIGGSKGIPLLWNIQGPELKIGCGGITFKGMFASIIDTDALEALLKDAGAALAWGIMMGLVYSLPGVADVLAKIQQFARELQKLLGNACNIGQSIGRGLANRASDYMDASNVKFLSDTKEHVDNAKKNINNALDAGMEWMKALPGELDDWANDKLPKNEQAGIIGTSIRDLINYKNFTNAIFSGMRDNLQQNGQITYPTVSNNDFYEAGSVIDLDIKNMETLSAGYEEKVQYNHMLKTLLLNFKVNIIGANYVNLNIVEVIAGYFGSIDSVSDEGEKKVKTELMKNLTTGDIKIMEFKKGNINEGLMLKLMLGTDATKSSDLTGTTKIAVPKLIPVNIKLGKNSSDTENIDLLYIDIEDADSTKVKDFYDLFNLKKINTCTLYNGIKTNTSLVDKLVKLSAQKDSVDEISSPDTLDFYCTDFNQSFGPALNVHRYTNIILQSNEIDAITNFETLYNYNLYKLNKAFYSLLSNMLSVDLEIKSNNSDNIKNVKQIAKPTPQSTSGLDQVKEEQDALKKFLKKYNDGIVNKFENFEKNASIVEDVFNALDKKNREEGLKSYGKSTSGQ